MYCPFEEQATDVYVKVGALVAFEKLDPNVVET